MRVVVNAKALDVPVGMSFTEWTRTLSPGSSPRFLAWNPVRPRTFKDVTDPFWNGKVFDLLGVVNGKDDLLFPASEIQEWLEYAPNVDLAELERIFVATHRHRGMMGFAAAVQDSLVHVDPDSVDVTRVKDGLHKELDEHASKAAATDVRLKRLRSVKPVDGFSDPVLIRTVFSVTVPEFGDRTAYEIVDSAVPTGSCPYISAGPFVKTIPGFKPAPEWPAQTAHAEGAVFFKADAEFPDTKPLKDMYRKYSGAAVVPGDVTYPAVITFDVPQGSRHVPPEDFAARVAESLRLDLRGRPLVEMGRVVSVRLDGMRFRPYVLTDLLVSDPDASHVMQTDELNRAHKIKGTVYAQVCGTGQTVSFQEKTDEDSGEAYISLRVRARDRKGVEELMEAAGRVMAIYSRRESEIVSFYALYDKTVAKEAAPPRPPRKSKAPEPTGDKADRKLLRTLAPDIFLPTYSRKCLHMPVILRGAELEDARKKGLNLMDFPLFGESERLTYACKHPQHPYPGLRANLLPNKAKYPFVPCCYSKDQAVRPNSKWTAYTTGNAEARRQGRIREGVMQAEPLPEGALIFLRRVLGQETGSKFFALRTTGVPETPVNAVHVAVFQRSLTAEEQAEERAAMALDPSAMGACAQELYVEPDVDWDRWRREMGDPNVPFNLLKYFRALETRYDCDIYIMDNKGIIHTKAVRGRLRYRSRRPTVILHLREESCVPVMTPPSDWTRGPVRNGILTFSPIDPITVKLHDLYQDSRPVYVDGVRVPPLRSDWLPCSGQVVDRAGKARVFVVTPTGKMSRGSFTLVTWPMPPLAAPILRTDTGFPRGRSDSPLSFLGSRFVPSGYRRSVETGAIREITGILDGACEACLLTHDPVLVPDPSWSDGGPPVYEDPVPSRALEGFTGAEKKARMLVEYAKKAISIREGSCTQESVRSFAANGGFVVSPGALDGMKVFNPRFEAPGPFAEADWAVKVPDVKTARRLVYALRVASVNGTCPVQEYASASLVPNFYKTSTDFVQSPAYTINVWRNDLDQSAVKKTRRAVVDWERGLAVPWPLPETELGFSYSLRFAGISRTFMAMNHPTWESAAFAALTWAKSGYCPGVTSNQIPEGEKVPTYACVKGMKPAKVLESGDGTLKLDKSSYGDVRVSGVMIYRASEGKPMQYVSLLM